MNIGQPATAPDTGTARLEKLQDSLNGKSVQSANTEELSQELEALFVSMMIKQMRQSEMSEGLFPGDRSDTLGGLFDDAMGQEIASVGGLGVADLIRETSTTPLGTQSSGAGRTSVSDSIRAYQNATGAFVDEHAVKATGTEAATTGTWAAAGARGL